MRSWKLITIALFLIIALLAATACNSGSGSTQQEVQVVKGNLVIKANGSGKVGVETDSRPSFGAGGKVTELLIKEGDHVTRGMKLAQLETDNLELALSQAQLAQAQAQVAVTQLKAAQTQADAALTSAQFNLDRTKAVSDILDDITEIQMDLRAANVQFEEARRWADDETIRYWTTKIAKLEYKELQKRNDLAELLNKDAFFGEFLYLSGQKYDRLAVEDARIKQLQVENARLAVQQAAENVEQAKRALDQANKAVKVAQKQLNDATITSPIDGTAVTVDIEAGDTVTTMSSPIYLADLSTIRIRAEIDEIDVANVKIGQKVIIKLDSAPDTQYDGKVNSIALAPVANPQNTGVVVYEVKIGFVNPPPPEVKLGMSATVDIIFNERNDVLLVPNRALITDNQGKTAVALLENKKIITRQVQTGISDGIYTEIISGLNAGDTVIVTRSVTSIGMFGQ